MEQQHEFEQVEAVVRPDPKRPNVYQLRQFIKPRSLVLAVAATRGDRLMYLYKAWDGAGGIDGMIGCNGVRSGRINYRTGTLVFDVDWDLAGREILFRYQYDASMSVIDVIATLDGAL